MDDELYTGCALKQLIQDLVDALDALVEPDSIFEKPLERARRTLEHWDDGYQYALIYAWVDIFWAEPNIDTHKLDHSGTLLTEFVDAKTEDGTVYYPAWIDYNINNWVTKIGNKETVINPVAWRYHDSSEEESNE